MVANVRFAQPQRINGKVYVAACISMELALEIKIIELIGNVRSTHIANLLYRIESNLDLLD